MADFTKAIAGLGDDAGRFVGQAARNGQIPGVPGSPTLPHKQAAVDPLDDTIKKLEQTEETVSQGFMKYVFPVQIGLMAGGWALGGLAKLTGSAHLEKWGQGVEAMHNASFKQVAAKVPVMGKAVGVVAGGVTEVGAHGASVAAKGLEATGFAGWRARRWQGKAVARWEGLGNHFSALHAQASHPEAKAAIGSLHEYLRDPAHLAANHAGFTSAVENAETVIGQHHPKLGGAVGKLGSKATKFLDAHQMTNAWGGLSGHLRDAPARLANAPVLQTAMNASFIVGAGLSDIRTGMSAVKGLQSLKEMYADLMHVKQEDVFAAQLLLGKMPEPLAAARAQLVKEHGPSMVLDAMNSLMSVDFALRKHGVLNRGAMGFGLMMAFGIGSQLMRNALQGNLLPAYHGIREAHKTGEAAPAEFYAALVGESAKELRQRGGCECESAKALGEVYAKLQMEPGDVLREVMNGKVQSRLEAMRAQYGHHEQPAAHPAETTASGHHVARMNGDKAQEKPVMGKHTRQVVHGAPSPAGAGVSV